MFVVLVVGGVFAYVFRSQVSRLKNQCFKLWTDPTLTSFFLQITRVVEGIETAIFKQFFVSWNENENASFGFGRYDMMRVEWY